MTIKRWVFVAGALLALAAIATGAWWVHSLYGRSSQWEKMYYDCLASPSDTLVVWRDRVVFSDDTIRPVSRKQWKTTDTIVIHDTVFVLQDVYKNYYADSYKKDGIRINWEAVTTGTLETIRFPVVVVPEKIVTVEKKVVVHDTLLKIVEPFHFGFYSKMFVNNFIDFPAIEAGAIISFKGKGGVMAGAMYNTPEMLHLPPGAPDKTPLYFTLGGFFYIK